MTRHVPLALARSPIMILLLLSLKACSGEREPKDRAPASRERVDAAAPKPAPVDAGPPSVQHQVAEGETLWDIARAYGVPVSEIRRANGLRERDERRLSKGKSLTIPGARAPAQVETAAMREQQRSALPQLEDGAYHFLARGENLWTLARSYDVAIEALMERNSLSEDDVGGLREGQAIIVPGIKPEQVKKAEPVERSGIEHQLARGESIWSIAHSFRVSVSEIMAANGLSADEVTALREGRSIFIPGVTEDKRGKVRRQVSLRERRALAVARRLGLGSRSVASQLLRGRVEPRWAKAAADAGPFNGTLLWPVTQGWYVRGYGSGEGGYHLAVDIMGRIGWNVRAAAPGIVGYSGDEVPGYGNMVMVVHPGGWVTMYAHNSVNFVVAGERVPRGAILAEVGSTGISRGPHVHFELMHGGKNCDPAPLFRPGVRHRNERLSAQVAAAVWRKPGERPKEVRCGPRRRHPRSRWVIHEDPEGDGLGAESEPP